MSQLDPAPTDPHQEPSSVVPSEQLEQIRNAFDTLVEDITSWLIELGNWLFGGLIAFNLLIVAALLTVGPVDPAILVSTVAFALALPTEVAGFVLLRLDQDLKHVGFEEEVAQAFKEVDFPGKEQVISPTRVEARRKRRTRVVLYYCLGILLLSVVLTMTGITAALWHMAWWIGVAFLAMALISSVVVFIALAASQPAASTEEKERKRRSREEIIKQATKERGQRK